MLKTDRAHLWGGGLLGHLGGQLGAVRQRAAGAAAQQARHARLEGVQHLPQHILHHACSCHTAAEDTLYFPTAFGGARMEQG